MKRDKHTNLQFLSLCPTVEDATNSGADRFSMAGVSGTHRHEIKEIRKSYANQIAEFTVVADCQLDVGNPNHALTHDRYSNWGY